MKTNYTISIPKPCHEDWSKMTPNAKGRFCKSCTKTVVDFTKMTPKDIQDYIHNNKHNRICGHIKQSQLNTVNLKIPETVFNQNLSFQRLFLIALLVSMGITLFNCEDESGRKKKIESVEVTTKAKDTLSLKTQKTNNTKENSHFHKDSVVISKSKPKTPPKPALTGLVIVETGEVAINSLNIKDLDTTEIKKTKYCTLPKHDNLIEPVTMGDIALDIDKEEPLVGFINIENPQNLKTHLSI